MLFGRRFRSVAALRPDTVAKSSLINEAPLV